MLPSADTTFNYGVLSQKKAASARAAAERIRGRLNAAFIETGRDLAIQKDALGHGNFLKWIDAEFGLGERSAQHLMNVAQMIDSNPNSRTDLEKLSQYTLRTLAAPSTPEPVRAEVLERASNGEKVTAKQIDELRKKLSKAEEEKKKAVESASLMEGRAQTIERELDGANLARLYAEQDKQRLADDLLTANEEIERLKEPGVITQFNEAFVAPAVEPTPWTDDDAQFLAIKALWGKTSTAARVRFLKWAELTSLSDDIAA
jgi:predicted ribosome quality control (RQC) complex YloA/Tae2 family protein